MCPLVAVQQQQQGVLQTTAAKQTCCVQSWAASQAQATALLLMP
jgi:hypothetical protein